MHIVWGWRFGFMHIVWGWRFGLAAMDIAELALSPPPPQGRTELSPFTSLNGPVLIKHIGCYEFLYTLNSCKPSSIAIGDIRFNGERFVMSLPCHRTDLSV